jgi:predicted esterase
MRFGYGPLDPPGLPIKPEQVKKGLQAGRKGNMIVDLTPTAEGIPTLRLYFPKSYKHGEPYKLMITLHGATGNHNTFFGPLSQKLMKNYFVEAVERDGWVVASPMSLQVTALMGLTLDKSAWRPLQVLGVIEMVKSMIGVEPEGKPALVGHSQGGRGALRVGVQFPDRFSSVVALSPFVPKETIEASEMAQAKNLRLYYGQGAKDTLSCTKDAREWVAQAKKAGMENLVYDERCDAGHPDIVVPTIDAVFQFIAGK